MKIMNSHLKGILITGFGVLVLTPDTMLMRLIDQDSHTMVFWRGISLGLALLLAAWIEHHHSPINWKIQFKPGGWMIGLSFAVSSYCFILAIDYTSIANLLVILALIPLWAALFSRILMREHLPWQTLLTIFACFCGIVIVFFEGLKTQNHGLGELYALGASIALGLNFTLIRYYKNINASLMNGLGNLGLAALMLPLAPYWVISPPALYYSLILCLLVLPISFYLIMVGPRYITSAEVGLLMLLETGLGPLWVWLVIGESPGFYTFIGGGITVLSILLHAIWRVKLAKP